MSGQSEDGLDTSAWEGLSAVVTAACSGEREAFTDQFRQWASSRPVGEQQKIGLYLFAAVKYMVKVSVQGDPSVADLKRIATRCLPDVQRVLTVHPLAVEDALRRAFGLPFIRRQLTPGELLVLNAAISGSLLDQLGAELGAIREWVAAWWKVNVRSARDAGLQG